MVGVTIVTTAYSLKEIVVMGKLIPTVANESCPKNAALRIAYLILSAPILLQSFMLIRKCLKTLDGMVGP